MTNPERSMSNSDRRSGTEFRIAAAQLGPVARTEKRSSVVSRMLRLLEQAKAKDCSLLAFPELALTTFFPRWNFDETELLGHFFERDMPSKETKPLFEAARRLGVAFSFGYAEYVPGSKGGGRFNTSVLVGSDGTIRSKYRKVHLPGHALPQGNHPTQHLEKMYFEIGDLGWPVVPVAGLGVGMCLCNDRRWPEVWRALALGGADIVLVGYNTPRFDPEAQETDRLAEFHNHLVLQAAAYQNSVWIIAAAKAGCEEGQDLIGGSCIVSPTGEIVAQAATLDDEIVVATCRPGDADIYRRTIFDFERHRRPETYSAITEVRGRSKPIGDGPRNRKDATSEHS